MYTNRFIKGYKKYTEVLTGVISLCWYCGEFIALSSVRDTDLSP